MFLNSAKCVVVLLRFASWSVQFILIADPHTLTTTQKITITILSYLLRLNGHTSFEFQIRNYITCFGHICNHPHGPENHTQKYICCIVFLSMYFLCMVLLYFCVFIVYGSLGHIYFCVWFAWPWGWLQMWPKHVM